MESTSLNNMPRQLEESEYPEKGSIEEKLRYLISCALLAPSVHNTQPWAFSVEGSSIRLLSDHTRCLRAADRDMRDLFVSLGCALENLCIAAEHYGFRPSVQYVPQPENPMLAAIVTMSPEEGAVPSEVYGLFRAIAARRTNHARFSPESVSEYILHHLTSCCVDPEVSLFLTGDPDIKRQYAELLTRADIIRFSNSEYVDELDFWVRQGAYDTPWMVKKLHELACQCRGCLTLSDADVLKGAPVLGVVATEQNDRESQLLAGRVFERIFLRATLEGLSLEPITYILQVAETYALVRNSILKSERHPQVTFRLGYSTVEPRHTPRRSLEEVLVDSAILGTHAAVAAARG